MLLQCTKKLLQELKTKPELQAEEDPLFSWHANLLTVNRRKTLVMVNDKNRYVIILHGLKAKDVKKLDEFILQSIREAFEYEGIKEEIIDEFIDRSKEIVYTNTKDRTSVARMNKSCESVHFFEEYLNPDFICQSALSKKISQLLVGNGKKDYITPNEEMYKDLEDFFGKTIFSSIAVELKVTLNLEKHHVMRKLVIPIDITFFQLHKVLQAAFGWRDYHLHEFYIKSSADNKPIFRIVSHEEDFDVSAKLETQTKLSDFIDTRIQYNYDFGDNWQHDIEVVGVINDYDKNHPICLEGEGNTPPEDVGGEPGYIEFLNIIADQKHPDYTHTVRWGTQQGFSNFNIDMVNSRLKYM